MSSAIDIFVSRNQNRFLDELKEFIRIPSISTLPEHTGDIARAAEFVAEKLRAVGMENIEIIPTPKHPLVYADWLHAPGKPTVLCYGHYDVQPADPLELWTTPPFEPAERNGNLYARGAVDDKGQMYMHIKALEALRAVNGTLPVNVKFLVEGEEEVGGASIAEYVSKNAKKLKADVALVSDTAMYAEGMPTLCIGLRGLVYMEVEATGPARDLHSGLYGGGGAECGIRADRTAGEGQECRWHDSSAGHLSGCGRTGCGGTRKLATEGCADREQVRDDAERGDQRRPQRDQEQEEAQDEDDADDERRFRDERLLEIVVRLPPRRRAPSPAVRRADGRSFVRSLRSTGRSSVSPG